MIQAVSLLLIACLSAGFVTASPDDNIVFRSDVSLVRVDAHVVDGNNRTITKLTQQDFVLREEGQPQPITHFGSEDLPMDVLFLLDVSASMAPHVRRIADASGHAVTVLGKEDRIAIMVFDRSTRVRLPFSNHRDDVQRAFDRLLSEEQFNGGTDISRAIVEAAGYIGQEGRRDARKAIVILTDDQTELERDDVAVMRALTRSDAVLCALIAPDAMHSGERRDPFDGMLSPGLRRMFPGNSFPRIMDLGKPRTNSAGTSEIALDSGGDSMPVNDASALEETLARIRQRYALFFNLPEGVKTGQERNIEVELTPDARTRFPNAQIRYRRVYMTPVAQGA